MAVHITAKVSYFRYGILINRWYLNYILNKERIVSEANLLISTHDGVREITLNRPEKKNALDGQLFSALAEAMQQARQDDDVHVVMLLGVQIH